jgi:capsular polysaccharide transport system ATP-binding protein
MARSLRQRGFGARMIQFENVTKVYHARGIEKRVLDQQSFVIERGRAIGVVGANGAGKSTLTRLIAGIEFPTSGRIRRGMSISWPLGFGGAFQGSLTGADNTRFIARIYGRHVADTLDYVEAFAELGRYLHMPVKTYSSGMRARLAFAVSLAIKFDCYLVDEITAVGDNTFRQRCEAALKERRQTGTLIMVSHDAHTLRSYCDTGAILSDGVLTFFATIDETIAAYDAMFAPPPAIAAVAPVPPVAPVAARKRQAGPKKAPAKKSKKPPARKSKKSPAA